MHKSIKTLTIFAILVFFAFGGASQSLEKASSNIISKDTKADEGLTINELSKNQKAQIRAEEIYRNEVRKQLQKELKGDSWKSRTIKALNSPLAIWFLSTVVIGIFTLLYNKIKHQKENSETILKLDREITSRLAYFEELVDHKKPKSFSEYHGLLSVLRYDTPASRIFEGFRERTTTSMLVELSQRVPKKEKNDVKSAIDALKTISKYNPHSNVEVEDLIGLIEKIKLNRWK